MEVHLALDGRDDLAGRLYRQIRDAVLAGRLPPGTALPATRGLAADLGVARGTVAAAYERLAAEGFLRTRVGSGTFVAEGFGGHAPARAAGALRPLPVWEGRRAPVALAEGLRHDFRPGHPDVALFPWATWRRLLTAELRAGAVGSGMYGDPAGHPGLRAAIAARLAASRSVRADPDDLIVTAGAQQAIGLIARVLLPQGATVAVEEPGYPPVRHALVAAGMRVVGVPVDAAGLVVDALPGDARLVYLTPSHQFPLGMPMAPARRAAVLDWADRHDACVVEDDYDSEFRFAGRPLEPLHTLDTTGRVLYVGSFSKTMLPTLRLGFLLAPSGLRTALRAAKYAADWHTPLPEQKALAAFLTEGSFARHIRRMHRVYADRRTRLLAALPPHLVPVPSAAGLHLGAWLPPGTDDTAAASAAARHGVSIYPLSMFARAAPPGLVLGFGALPDVESATAALTSALSPIRPG
ncbi:GntR family transcriptional regulator [Actinocorallia herbida]|uniref:GntR family transcriptional regulator n=1 Tax=Actinocorallia herbida TaxID=58109 RepID=A0A3N1CWR4_9ACTN|nr:PLP-dependent aminotransferase family protein [Actinocorallia herbida]ROO85731.1 GntR family transcriptional regulator [Actinocorallia herbida]